MREKLKGSVLERATMLDALQIAGIAAPDKSGFTRCPFHNDRRPSLHLVGPKGAATGFKCFSCGANGGILDFLVQARIAADYADAARVLEGRLGASQMEGRVVASFAYDDGTDKVIARVVRIEPGRDGRSKNFLPYRVDGKEIASKPGLDGLQLPLYQRSEVLLAARESGTIFLVEGEGKADLLRASLAESRTSGAVTTVPHGANACMRDAHVADFVGAGRVIVVADSDTVGRAAARPPA
ncbi:MAG: CHC2 zinc finger domain-containing protein, partial [Candidatus Cybelea sp.]